MDEDGTDGLNPDLLKRVRWEKQGEICHGVFRTEPPIIGYVTEVN